MTLTALHHLLDRPSGPVTGDMLDEAIALGIKEADDLDWKRELPAKKGLPQSDFPKDVAAMANRGGGTIVYGIKELDKAAVERYDAGDFDEAFERAMRIVARTAITPPVVGLSFQTVEENELRAVVMTVLPSIDAPHLVYRNDYFGAPIRFGADTVWMREPEIERMYRERFRESREAERALENLFEEARENIGGHRVPGLIAVARPRIPVVAPARISFPEAERLVLLAQDSTSKWTYNTHCVSPPHAAGIDMRPGLRRWDGKNKVERSDEGTKGTWRSIYQNGAVTIASELLLEIEVDNGEPRGMVHTNALEAGVIELMGLIQVVGRHMRVNEYEACVRINFPPEMSMALVRTIPDRHIPSSSWPTLQSFRPVSTIVTVDTREESFRSQVHDYAQDCISQGGFWETNIVVRQY